MRISVTLDPDLAASIGKVMAERNLTVEQAVNEVLRVGLTSGRDAFSPRTVHLGEASMDLDTALEVAAALEDPVLIEKLAMRRSS